MTCSINNMSCPLWSPQWLHNLTKVRSHVIYVNINISKFLHCGAVSCIAFCLGPQSYSVFCQSSKNRLVNQNHKSISTQSTLEEEVGSGFPSYPLHRKDTSETLYSHETSTVRDPTHPTQNVSNN